MANTYTQLYIQFVFPVQNRFSLIQPDWKDELYKYITGIVQRNGHKLITINGIPDHIHIFVGYKPHQLIPELLQDIKGDSSRWINKRGLVRQHFQWQAGYGAFSYSHGHIDRVYKYIQNQEQHHRRKSFIQEYQELLDRYQIDFESRYIFKKVE
jgi:REP element-mobilizing transposase RayT